MTSLGPNLFYDTILHIISQGTLKSWSNKHCGFRWPGTMMIQPWWSSGWVHAGIPLHNINSLYKTTVFPLLMHWRYCSVTLSHQYHTDWYPKQGVCCPSGRIVTTCIHYINVRISYKIHLCIYLWVKQHNMIPSMTHFDPSLHIFKLHLLRN